jgi:hypothetical protein
MDLVLSSVMRCVNVSVEVLERTSLSFARVVDYSDGRVEAARKDIGG